MKFRNFAVMMSFILVIGALLSACGGANDNGGEGGSGGEGGGDSDFTVAMVTDTGGVNDKSFNQSAWEGLTKFGKEFGLKEGEGYTYLQSNAATDYAPNLNKLIREGYDLVFGIGFLMATDVKNVAMQQPDAQLAIVDTVVKKDNGELVPNVANITFKEHQGSFLVGVVAGLQTKTNKVGFIGGVESALISKFENGFKAGVKAVNPDAEIFVQYAASFSDAAKAQAIASTMYSKDADIIYHAAGGAGNGVFTEAKNRKKNGEEVWVIGVDRDQYEEGLPENVTLTSMVKRVDVAVYEVAKQTKNGDFPGGEVITFGLEDEGVGIAPTKKNVSEEALQKVEEYKKKIIDGDITVPKTDAEYKEYLSSL